DMGGVSGDSLLSAGILLGIMVLPTIMTFADDALRSVPKSFREAAMGLGLAPIQVIVHVVLPKAKQGVVAACLLGLGRAIGETIAIYMVVGRSDMPFDFESLSLHSLVTSGQTITTKLGGSELSIAYGDPRHWSAMMALGLCLWGAVG